MWIKFWGVRGSYPVSRPEMQRYGGNTTCVEIRAGTETIVIDAGTGMYRLSRALERSGERFPHGNLHVLMTHMHWDHILGFPFFDPLYHAENRVAIYGLRRDSIGLQQTLAGSLSDPLTTVTLDRLPAQITFHEVEPYSSVTLAPGITVRTTMLNHPYRVLGYRVEAAGRAFVFAGDTAPFDRVLLDDDFPEWDGEVRLTDGERAELARMERGLEELAHGADWLCIDAQFTAAEYARVPHWGHGTPEYAIALARRAGVRELLLFHHSPGRSDADLDALATQLTLWQNDPSLRVRLAREGDILE